VVQLETSPPPAKSTSTKSNPIQDPSTPMISHMGYHYIFSHNKQFFFTNSMLAEGPT
jgi:hypothetical protein